MSIETPQPAATEPTIPFSYTDKLNYGTPEVKEKIIALEEADRIAQEAEDARSAARYTQRIIDRNTPREAAPDDTLEDTPVSRKDAFEASHARRRAIVDSAFQGLNYSQRLSVGTPKRDPNTPYSTTPTTKFNK